MKRKADDAEGFGGRLEEAILRAGIKKSALAASMGVDAARISEWLAGRSVPMGHHMIALVEALGCDANWLLTGAGRGADARKLERIRQILDEPPTDEVSSDELETGTPDGSGNGGSRSPGRRVEKRAG
jgi:transcriptional regulator with XRE-family HTH domain